MNNKVINEAIKIASKYLKLFFILLIIKDERKPHSKRFMYFFIFFILEEVSKYLQKCLNIKHKIYKAENIDKCKRK